MAPVVQGPRCNRRVTCDSSPSNARSESAVAANPLDPYNLVGASKRFTNPSIYAFSLAAYATFDGGQSWIESPPLTLGDPNTPSPPWAGTSDPAVAWDNAGNAYLVALPFGQGTPTDYTGPLIGIAVYKSSDGGRTWGAPKLIHQSGGDDKQWAAGDLNPTSPYYGNVYAAWDNGSNLAFARTTDHGATWKGVLNQPAGASIPGVPDSFAPELSVAADGSIYIVWTTGTQIKFVKSTDGGGTFSASAVVANGITPIPGTLPGGKFRTYTLPTGCTGTGKIVVCAWADYRGGVSRIYYRRSTNGGNSWQGSASGDPLVTGALASAAGQHDFHPQLISTPNGEIGCAFYEFGPKGSGEFVPSLVDVVLAVSTNGGNSFANRVTVTEQAWDPTVDAPLAHGNPNLTFIGDYFGLDASRLGFFPFWTDTRTGAQEIFTARVAVNPADVYIRDASTDTGVVPYSSPNYWEAPDLIVRRQQDGNATFVNQDLLRDGVTDHYLYAKVTNKGPNAAANVTLAVTVANWPELAGLPGTEFRYPQDWYQGNWSSAGLLANRLWLGESQPINVPSGQTKVIGPVLWPAGTIPDPKVMNPWHPCLLAEIRADNDDSAGGLNGCGIDADPDPCYFGSYFWGNNNVCQRNLSYAKVPALAAAHIELPFIVGSLWSRSSYLEVIVDKGPELAWTPMTLRMDPIRPPSEPVPRDPCDPGELILVDGGRVVVRVDHCDVGEIVAAPGTSWRCPRPRRPPVTETSHGGEKVGGVWQLTQPRSSVGFSVGRGELRRITLSFATPRNLRPRSRSLVRIFQRNDRHIITGNVLIELQVGEAKDEEAGDTARRRRRRGRRRS
jgi:hypothetical protein